MLAADDVVDVRYRHAILLHMSLPSVIKGFNAVWRKDQIQVKRAVTELYEILTQADLFLFPIGEPKTQLQQRGR